MSLPCRTARLTHDRLHSERTLANPLGTVIVQKTDRFCRLKDHRNPSLLLGYDGALQIDRLYV